MNPELDHYLKRIDDLRGQVCALLSGLSVEALNWRPIEGSKEHATNSLAVLAAHIAGAEHFWIGEVVGGMPGTRNRDAEFATRAGNATILVALLDKVGAESRQVFASMTHTDLDDTREVGGRSVPVRWAILHVIDHTALHLGHMQLTYQLWKGGQAGPSPRWFERIEQ